MHEYREHNFLGTTKSLCPQCLALVDAKIITKNNRVYFRKFCPKHGFREDFVCSDATHFDRNEFTLPGKEPTKFGIEPKRGCPYDCGVCTGYGIEHVVASPIAPAGGSQGTGQDLDRGGEVPVALMPTRREPAMSGDGAGS